MVIYKSPMAAIPLPNVDLYTFLFTKNEYNTRYPSNRKIFIDGFSGESITFDQLKDQSSRLATGWTETVGLGYGDVVAVFAPNQYDHALLFLSLLAAKCTITPGNPAYTKDELLHQIQNSGARAVVTVPELLPILSQVCEMVGIPKSRIFLFGDKGANGCKPFRTILSNRPTQLPIQGINASNDAAFICYSSGTTGVAKGVMLTHRNFIAQILQSATLDEEYARDDDVLLGFLPFYHIFGLTSLVLSSCYQLSTVVVLQKFSIELFCQLVQKYKITVGHIVPPVAVLLAKSPVVVNYDLTSLRLLGCGAAPLSSEHIKALELRIPAKMKQGYGMTETTSGIITQKLDDVVPGSIGVLLANSECKIVDEHGNELGNDQEGELLFRGPSIMKGYFNNTKANAATFTLDGWLRTGDVGKFDSASGHFFIVDRIKELIKYKGFQVAPAEIEAILMSRPDIADCCVVGVYDASQATELPRAYVVLQGKTNPSEQLAKDIMSYVAERSVNYKTLRGGVRFIKAVPKSPSGKILRRVVKDWVRKEQTEEVQQARL